MFFDRGENAIIKRIEKRLAYWYGTPPDCTNEVQNRMLYSLVSQHEHPFIWFH
jgi:hypothetical protein